MQYSQLRGLRLIIIIGLISTIVASCSSVSEPPPLDAAELPQNNPYTHNTPESDNHSKSNSASISSNQDASLPQENTDGPQDLPFDRDALQLKGITLDNVAADVIQIWGHSSKCMHQPCRAVSKVFKSENKSLLLNNLLAPQIRILDMYGVI